MKFIAHYTHRSHKPYWRTVFADDINEATVRALCYRKKDYDVSTIKQVD